MRKPSALSTAISGILFGASVIPVVVALAQDGDDVEQIEEIVTTGSRIIRTDKFDTAGHVIPIDEVAIDALAELNIADVLRSSQMRRFVTRLLSSIGTPAPLFSTADMTS